jgi:Ala-tRNA(Pro) deacylase
MSIAYCLQDYIAEHDLPWDPVRHQASGSCMQSARYAHVAPDRVAKAVVLKGRKKYLVAVIPANRQLDLEELREVLGEEVSLAQERSLSGIFFDCAQGAVPPVGEAYGLATRRDPSLGDRRDVYFAGGDHRTLVHMDGWYFSELMRGARPLHVAVH